MRARVLFVGASLIWAGMILGVSFVATPAKFLAPSLALPVALDVGRHTFSTFAKVEWTLAFGCAALATASDNRRRALAVSAMLVVLLAVQAYVLIPDLDRRVGLYLAGQPPPRSPLHIVYVAIELAKIAVLLTGAMLCRSAADAAGFAAPSRPAP